METNMAIVKAVEKFKEVVRETEFCYNGGFLTSHEFAKSVVKSYEDIVMPVLGEDCEEEDLILADTAFGNALIRGFIGDDEEE